MAICEQCGKEHDGSFGSGRFCNRSCSNKWVSLHQSDEAKAKKVEKGRANLIPGGSGYVLSSEDRLKGLLVYNENRRRNAIKLLEDVLNNRRPAPSKLLRYLVNYGYKESKCECCGGTTWNGECIPLQIHHEDGNTSNNSLENLKVLCPNCHAQTPNYSWRKVNLRKKS